MWKNNNFLQKNAERAPMTSPAISARLASTDAVIFYFLPSLGAENFAIA